MLEAGVSLDGGKTYSLNVIPNGSLFCFPFVTQFLPIFMFIQIEARAGFDIRISPGFPMEEMLGLLDKWAAEAGEGVSWENVPEYKVFFFFFFFFFKFILFF